MGQEEVLGLMSKALWSNSKNRQTFWSWKKWSIFFQACITLGIFCQIFSFKLLFMIEEIQGMDQLSLGSLKQSHEFGRIKIILMPGTYLIKKIRIPFQVTSGSLTFACQSKSSIKRHVLLIVRYQPFLANGFWISGSGSDNFINSSVGIF